MPPPRFSHSGIHSFAITCVSFSSSPRVWCGYAKEFSKVSYGRVTRYYSVPSDFVELDPVSYRPCLIFVVKVQSSNLWTSQLTKKQIKNYELVKKFRSEGLTYKQISKELNDRGYTPTRTGVFSPSLVHSLEKKMDKRIDRITRVFYPEIDDMNIVFEDVVIHKRKDKTEILSPK